MNSQKSFVLFLFMSIPYFLMAQTGIHQEATKLLDSGQFEKASSMLSQHLEKADTDQEARFLYGRSLIKLEKHEEAIVQLKSLRKSMEKRADFHFWYGQAYLGKLNASKNFFEKGIVASKVKEAFERSVALDPENLSARNSLAQYYLNAPGIAGGSTKKAKEQIDFIKSRDPRMGYYAMASYYFQKKEYQQAKEEYVKYLEIAEKKSEVLYQIGFINQIEKDFDSAFQYFQRSVKEAPVFVPSYYQYARTAIFAEKNVAKGIEMMKVYLNGGGADNGPDLPSAFWRLGMLYELQGDKQEAKNAYEKALELNPEHEQALSAMKSIK